MSIHILGIAQDGGVPHLNCSCTNCIDYNYKVASIAIKTDSGILMVDATPDMTAQWNVIKPDAILLTHLHIGHYIGLLQLGREVASTNKFPVYLTSENAEFLRSNKPFSYLIDRGEIELIEIEIGKNLLFDSKVAIYPFEVPHRNEDGNTIGIQLITDKSYLYIPDIDYFSDDVIERINNAEFTLLDGTFWEIDELQRQDNIPHPPITHTMNRMSGNNIIFIHLNHSNPALNPQSTEYRIILEQNFSVAYEGQIINI